MQARLCHWYRKLGFWSGRDGMQQVHTIARLIGSASLLLSMLMFAVACSGREEAVIHATPTQAVTAAIGGPTAAEVSSPSPAGAATAAVSQSTVVGVSSPVSPAATPARASGTPEPEGWQRHSTPDFQIDVPDSWDVFDVPNPSMGPMALGGGINILIANAPDTPNKIPRLLELARAVVADGTTIEELLGGIKADIEAEGGTVLTMKLSQDPGGREVGALEYSKSERLGIQQGIVYVVSSSPGRAYFLNFTTSEADFNEALTLFAKIASSFRVLSS